MRLAIASWGRRRDTSTSTADVTAWSRGRLIGILATAVAVAVVLLIGLVYAIYSALHGVSNDAVADGINTGETSHSTRALGPAHRDEVAAAPMLEVPQAAMFEGDEAQGTAPTIEIPAGTATGPGAVLTGFPHTPEGAIGQLAQIDATALQTMDLQTTQQIYLQWALPGGVGPQRWWITTSVNSFLSTAGMGQARDAGSMISAEPAAALVKGTDGPDWVTACVLLKVSASYKQEGAVGFGHCERMQWVGGRWMIAPGQPPAPAPSTWPGTELAKTAGWRTWTTITSDFEGTN